MKPFFHDQAIPSIEAHLDPDLGKTTREVLLDDVWIPYDLCVEIESSEAKPDEKEGYRLICSGAIPYRINGAIQQAKPFYLKALKKWITPKPRAFYSRIR